MSAKDAPQRAVRAQFAEVEHVFCEYCARRVFLDRPQVAPDRAVGDHRIPLCRMGSYIRPNIAIVCNECNTKKAYLTESEYRSVVNDDAARVELLRSVIPTLSGVS